MSSLPVRSMSSQHIGPSSIRSPSVRRMRQLLELTQSGAPGGSGIPGSAVAGLTGHQSPAPTPSTTLPRAHRQIDINPAEYTKYKLDKPVVDAIGMSGMLWYHLLAGRGLRAMSETSQAQQPMIRDLYCVLECDRIHKARTVVRSGDLQFDWDESFELDLVRNKQLDVLVYHGEHRTWRWLWIKGRRLHRPERRTVRKQERLPWRDSSLENIHTSRTSCLSTSTAITFTLTKSLRVQLEGMLPGRETWSNGYHHDEVGSNHMLDGSSRSEDMQNGNTTSMSSPSIKSESDAHSPGQPPIGCWTISTATACNRAIDGPAWPYADDVLEVADMPYVLREIVDLGGLRPTTGARNTGGPLNRFTDEQIRPTSRRSTGSRVGRDRLVLLLFLKITATDKVESLDE